MNACPTCGQKMPKPPTVRHPLRPLDDTLDDWDFLRRQGYSVRDAADRLGMSHAALDKALCRAKAAGDPRAVRRAS